VNLARINFKLKRLLPGFILAATLFAPVRHGSAQQPSPSGGGGGQLSSPEAQSPEKNKQEVDQNDAYLHSP
jgi:F-type H+-transporting ATPase subunit b